MKNFSTLLSVALLSTCISVNANASPTTTIVATVGPASSSVQTLGNMMIAGMDFARINFSHGSHEANAALVQSVREAAKTQGKHIPILVDLQGPKYRVGKFKDGHVTLKQGEKFVLDLKSELGDANRVTFTHPELYAILSEGSVIMLTDGKQALKVTSISKDRIETIVEVGGELYNNRGVNLPNLKKTVQVITDKDTADVKFAMENIKPEYFALSFVQNGNDIKALRKLIGDRKVKVVAKIETALALENLDSIAKEADVLMVARGDMGVEIGIEKVPVMQKRIVAAAKKHGKRVIVATEMMQTMTDSPVPTRAEVSDVANAVYQCADSVMLSNETAVGKYPVETVQTMNKVLEYTEAHSKRSDCSKR